MSSTQNTRLQRAFDDVASNISQALVAGRVHQPVLPAPVGGPRRERRRGRGQVRAVLLHPRRLPRRRPGRAGNYLGWFRINQELAC